MSKQVSISRLFTVMTPDKRVFKITWIPNGSGSSQWMPFLENDPEITSILQKKYPNISKSCLKKIENAITQWFRNDFVKEEIKLIGKNFKTIDGEKFEETFSKIFGQEPEYVYSKTPKCLFRVSVKTPEDGEYVGCGKTREEAFEQMIKIALSELSIQEGQVVF